MIYGGLGGPRLEMTRSVRVITGGWIVRVGREVVAGKGGWRARSGYTGGLAFGWLLTATYTGPKEMMGTAWGWGCVPQGASLCHILKLQRDLALESGQLYYYLWEGL